MDLVDITVAHPTNHILFSIGSGMCKRLRFVWFHVTWEGDKTKQLKFKLSTLL